MRIVLPRLYSGQEIVWAFETASYFHETLEKKWESEEVVGEYQYESGSVKQTVFSKGVKAFSSSLRNKWTFFGALVWKRDFTPRFILEPVALNEHYHVIEVLVEHTHSADNGIDTLIATSPHSLQFEEIRPQFEKILNRFFSFLHNYDNPNS